MDTDGDRVGDRDGRDAIPVYPGTVSGGSSLPAANPLLSVPL